MHKFFSLKVLPYYVKTLRNFVHDWDSQMDLKIVAFFLQRSLKNCFYTDCILNLQGFSVPFENVSFVFVQVSMGTV